MAYFKNFVITLFILSAVNLCLGKPKWTWVQDVGDSGDMERTQDDIDVFGRVKDVLKRKIASKRLRPTVCTKPDRRDCPKY